MESILKTAIFPLILGQWIVSEIHFTAHLYFPRYKYKPFNYLIMIISISHTVRMLIATHTSIKFELRKNTYYQLNVYMCMYVAKRQLTTISIFCWPFSHNSPLFCTATAHTCRILKRFAPECMQRQIQCTPFILAHPSGTH